VSTSSELSLLETTLNGPAPTGVIRNFFSPSFLSAVGEAVQLAFESTNDAMTAA
jgi:hypothetical protein